MADDLPDVLEPFEDGHVPDGYLLCGDGKLYRQRIVTGQVVEAGSGGLGALERAESRIEKAMSDAITQAIADGIGPDDPAMRERVLAARQKEIDAINKALNV